MRPPLTGPAIAVGVPRAAAMIDCSPDVIRAAIRAHQDGHDGLPARKLGSRWSIRMADLEDWYQRQGASDA